jgi:ABC transporter substrate binding protein
VKHDRRADLLHGITAARPASIAPRCAGRVDAPSHRDARSVTSCPPHAAPSPGCPGRLAARGACAAAGIGLLDSQSADDSEIVYVPFLQGLKETGYVVGQNVAVEYRYAENQNDRLPAFAADLVRRRAAVILATSTYAALAAKAATTTIPIVFVAGGDPVALGLVASLNRPGANLTGSAVLTAELAPKRLQLLRELIPRESCLDGRDHHRRKSY